MKAFVVYGFNDMRLENVAEREVKPGEVLIKVRVVEPSISEVARFHGFHKRKRYEKLFPRRLFGHEFSGDVKEVGECVEGIKVHDRVTVDPHLPCGRCYACRIGGYHKCRNKKVLGIDIEGAFAEYVNLPAKMLLKLPDNITYNEGAFMQPFTSAVANVLHAQLSFDDTVAVLGQGVMGLGCMQVCRAIGVDTLITTDEKDYLLKVSSQLGADITINVKEEDPVKKVIEATNGIGADLVIDAAGGTKKYGLAGTETLQQAMSMVSPYGKILEISHIDAPIVLDPKLRTKGVEFIFGQYGGLSAYRHAVKLVASKRVDIKPLLTHKLRGLEKVPEAFAIMTSKARFNAIQAQVEL